MASCRAVPAFGGVSRLQTFLNRDKADDVAHRKLQLGQCSGNFGTSGYGLRVNNTNTLVADLDPPPFTRLT